MLRAIKLNPPCSPSEQTIQFFASFVLKGNFLIKVYNDLKKWKQEQNQLEKKFKNKIPNDYNFYVFNVSYGNLNDKQVHINLYLLRLTRQ